jgi:membrane dipeptidase
MRDSGVIFDGHNDLALRVWRGEAPRHIDLATAVSDGFAGGFFALMTPGSVPDVPERAPYSCELPPPVPFADASRDVGEMASVLEGLELTIVRHAAEIVPGRVNAIMHLEGAEPIAPDLSNLEGWYERGLRSIGLVWSRANAFAEGVPFRFPATPDTGPGLTRAGHDLVHACNLLGILVDLSHLNEAGFWEVARISQAPLVATHSNAYALCPSTRNLTDAQLDAIGESGGLVGINFAVQFLRADGASDPATPIGSIVEHVDYVASRIGVDHVGLGSDFEGALVPEELGGVPGMPRLLDALRAAGYDDEALDRIACRNWLRVLEQTLSPPRRGQAPNG